VKRRDALRVQHLHLDLSLGRAIATLQRGDAVDAQRKVQQHVGDDCGGTERKGCKQCEQGQTAEPKGNVPASASRSDR